MCIVNTPVQDSVDDDESVDQMVKSSFDSHSTVSLNQDEMFADIVRMMPKA